MNDPITERFFRTPGSKTKFSVIQQTKINKKKTIVKNLLEYERGVFMYKCKHKFYHLGLWLSLGDHAFLYTKRRILFFLTLY